LSQMSLRRLFVSQMSLRRLLVSQMSLRTSIRVFQEYSEKQRPAQHLHHLFIVPKGHHWIHRSVPAETLGFADVPAETLVVADVPAETLGFAHVPAALRGARDQYSSVPRVFGEAKTCATSSSSVHCSEGNTSFDNEDAFSFYFMILAIELAKI
jgi:hypothetical protein